MKHLNAINRLGPLTPLVVRTAHRARRIQLRLRATVQRHGLVLMYHRIAEPGSDPWDMAVSPDNFAAHLDVLKRYGACLPLADFAERLSSSDRPRRMIAITFDDGYCDNNLAAAPILEAHDVPATIFVVSGTVGAGRDFWWDALARVFLTMPRLPEELILEAGGEKHLWTLGPAAECTPAELQGFVRWSVDRDAASHLRQKTFLAVWALLFSRPPTEAEALCEAVTAWAGAPRNGPTSDHPMNAEELERLASGGLIEIGGHTASHGPLDAIDPATAASEIAGCRAQLRDMIGRDVTSFSFPFGRFRPGTPNLVRDAGFQRACNSAHHIAYPETDPFRIPRISVPDLDGDEFAKFLGGIAGP